MQIKKKIEIVIESVQIEKIINLFEKLELGGYTVIHGVMGKGSHGYHDTRGLSNVLSNSYVMSVCSPDDAEKLAQHIKPLIVRYGGICIVSDINYYLK